MDQDVVLIFADQAAPVLETKMKERGYEEVAGAKRTRGTRTGEEQRTRSIQAKIQSTLAFLRGAPDRTKIIEELEAEGLALQLKSLVAYFQEFKVDSIALNIAGKISGNVLVLAGEASAGITITLSIPPRQN